MIGYYFVPICLQEHTDSLDPQNSNYDISQKLDFQQDDTARSEMRSAILCMIYLDETYCNMTHSSSDQSAFMNFFALDNRSIIDDFA